MSKKIELIIMLEDCTKSKHKIKNIKDESVRFLVESIVNSRKSKDIINELKK